MSKVYSYVRFSAAKQAAGASVARQSDYAAKWAAEHGMELDDTLSMQDSGLSAYHQKHIKYGALGVFLAAIQDGKIPVGSTLIVESLDRLSRTDPIDAQAQLTQIINGGVSVVTAADGKLYNRATLKANPMDIVYSVLVMIRANEESEVKSKRVSDVLRRKCEGWIAGTYRGKISCGADPSWVRWNGERFELIPETARSIRLAAQWFSEGYGALKILKMLDDMGLSITGSKQAGNIHQLLGAQNHLFLGDRIVNASGTPYHLQGYYPPLLSPEEYSRLVVALAERKKAPRTAGGKTEFPGIVTGMGITTCGHCGGAMVAQNQKRDPKKGGEKINRRVICHSCIAKRLPGGCRVDVIENAILNFCADQLNLESLTAGTDQTAAIRAERAALAVSIPNLERMVDKMLDAALSAPDDLPQAVLTKMREYEQEIARDKARMKQLDAEISLAATYHAPANAAVWRALRAGVVALDYEARMKCKGLVADTFSKIQIYVQGTDDTPGRIDIMLTSKTGVERRLTIDRKTGELIGMARDGMHAEMIEDTANYAVAKVSIKH